MLSREILIQNQYINLPVKNDAPKHRVRFLVNAKTVREFEIELADAEPDFWVFSDVGELKGERLVIEADGLDSDSTALESIVQSDTIKEAENLYKEKYRPQFHFSSRRGWNNDPNGLVYYKGEYHLFYQHNPYGYKWGNMHWGHAVSRDLVHWKELPVALYPKQYGDWCFSGSGLVDKNNTAGFKTGDEDVLIAAYTSTGRGESIAYSNDRGLTWADYDGNPVVEHKGRDPKVIWHELTKKWVMAVYHEVDNKRTIAFYTSPDLKNWEYQSLVEDFYECPDLFELPVDGNENNRKWVLLAADSDYIIGTFDGRSFTEESGKHRGNYGNNFYASQTWSDIPAEDGRRIQIAWGRLDMPGMPFNQYMTFPCELTLRTTPEGIRMFSQPVREIENIHDKKHSWKAEILEPEKNLLSGVSGDLFDIRAEFEIGGGAKFGFNIRGVPVVYNVERNELSCKEKDAPLKPVDGKIRLQILVDRTSIEVFGNDGRVTMSIGVIPKDENKSIEVFSKGGNSKINSLDIYELRSSWE